MSVRVHMTQAEPDLLCLYRTNAALIRGLTEIGAASVTDRPLSHLPARGFLLDGWNR